MRIKTLTFTGLIFEKAKPDLRREEDPRFGDFLPVFLLITFTVFGSGPETSA